MARPSTPHRRFAIARTIRMHAHTSLRASLLAGVALAAFAHAAPAEAQTIDYGSLQQLFDEPVTTSATGKPQRASEAPAAMEIISADDIRRSGAQDIPTILSRYSGIDILQQGPISYDINVRGYNQPFSPRLLVLINGRQVYLDSYGYTAWATLPVQLSEIRQIEIVKGPNSALFGYNASSGVINIVTYNALYDDKNEASVTVGTNSHANGTMVATLKPWAGAGVRLSFGGLMQDAAERGYAQASPIGGVDPRALTFSADGLFQIDPTTQVGLTATQSNLRQSEQLPDSTLSDSDYSVTSYRGVVTKETGIGLVEGSAYANLTENVFNNIGTPRINVSNQVIVARLQNLVKLGTDHTVRLAGEYRNNSIDTTPISGAKVSYDIYSAGVMWNWDINDVLSLNNAARLDHMKLDRQGFTDAPSPFTNADWRRNVDAFSFNSGLVVKATDDDTIRFTIGRGIQSPSLVELGGVVLTADSGTPDPFVLEGSPRLDPTITTNFEVGYDRMLRDLGANVGIRAFHQINEDLRTNVIESELRSSWFNVGDSRMVGFEVSAKGTVAGGWRWAGNYTYTNVYDRLDDPLDETPSGIGWINPRETTPKHRANLSLGWSDGPWEIDAYASYVSAYSSRFGQTLSENINVQGSEYVTFGARVGYALTDGITVALSGKNLGQKYQRVTPVGYEADRQLYLTLTSAF
jgi:iron complex outermembrane receptor protein